MMIDMCVLLVIAGLIESQTSPLGAQLTVPVNQHAFAILHMIHILTSRRIVFTLRFWHLIHLNFKKPESSVFFFL